MTAMPDIISEPVETFPLGVQRYYVEDGEIGIVVSTGNMAYRSIDEWVEVMSDTIQQGVDALRPVFMMTMSSAGEHGFSRHAQQRIEDIQNIAPENFPVYVAMVFPPGIVSRFVSIFLNSMTRRSSNRRLHAEMFTDQDSAMKWLNHMRARHADSWIDQAV